MAPGTVLVLTLLGGLGAAARFLVDDLVNRRWHGAFPLATLVINVTGSLLIGLLATSMAADSPQAYAVGAVGFCGGYTTFSTAMVESVRLTREGAWRTAGLAAAGMLALCVGAAAAGALLGRALSG
ncbi:CrcB family protein [Ornithinimicrobium ciconiae]|uniref:Fluoride-specific ion channel FluC n=1 Tax=Ornithinimicrobium ciconiae TaxID=2594265 RepID=A0A516GF47_9MICO|nr:CrcB family protein [Ornithinimicrobium ciconiae]